MRLKISKSAHSLSYSVIKSAYINGKRTSVVVERLGNTEEIKMKAGGMDPLEWCRQYVAALNQKNTVNIHGIDFTLYPSARIDSGKRNLYNGGYLFLEDIYYDLGLNRISKAISKKHSFQFNLDSILSRLIYSRILFPSSKLSTYEQAGQFIEQPDFELHQVYRALSVIAAESDYIQSALYKNSLKLYGRNTGVIYYDCTNYFFEIEHSEGLKQYGPCKENRPLPIVEMGLFMDAEGIPLAFSITPGNTNEQVTMVPLEKKLLADFGMSRFVVCTDAGLSSTSNRKFNNDNGGNRAFVTTQSLRGMKKFLKDWAISTDGWHLSGEEASVMHDISAIDEEADKDKVFCKERWIKENGIEQRLIVTYSIKYRDYLRSVREGQVKRARNMLDHSPSGIEHKRQTDYKRFIGQINVSADGEAADITKYYLDDDAISKEAQYDGFYAVCTNLEDNISDIVNINCHRWQIEECFRIMKTDFEARPTYLSRDDRIKAHFMTCFIALIVYRYLEKKLNDRYTCSEIIRNLQEMEFLKVEGKGYIPAYQRNPLTDDLEKTFDFDLSTQIVTIEKMRSICALTKK
jgi:transposase